MLPKETLELIQKTAVGAAGVTVVEIPGDSRNVLLSGPDGYAKHELPPSDRNHTVASLDALIAAAKRYGQAGTLWHGTNSVVLLVDDGDRRDRVTLPLQQSEHFARIGALGRPLDQRAIIRLLRVDLSGAVSPDLVTQFRKLDFKRRNDGSSVVNHGKESLGRAVEAEVMGVSELPERIFAAIQVYRTPGVEWSQQIALILDVNPTTEEFFLCPEPDALHRAVAEVQARIGESLVKAVGQEGGPSVFYGQP